MCGIAGIWRLDAVPDGALAERSRADRAAVEAMLDALAHRGPDDIGIEAGPHGVCGVRRLSIIDVAGGHQPLRGCRSEVWAGQNGELYDFARVRTRLAALGHPFRTQSDTEILPHLYEERGVDFPRDLRGIFACFVVDDAARRFVLARDREGIKPAYYAVQGGRLAFASEIRALLADPRLEVSVDPERWSDYLALGYVPGPHTIYREIRKLSPGHRLVADANGVREERYDAPGDPDFGDAEPLSADANERERHVEALLARAASSQLVSDVPLGVLLSGGLDSSLLTALLPEPVRRSTLTFCVGFEDGGHHDERDAARRVAAHLGTRHVERVLHLDAAAWFARATGMSDEPLADAAAVPALAVADAASEHVKVLLSGTGGDELFGGYRRYRVDALRRRLGLVPRAWAESLAERLGARAGSRTTRLAEARVFAAKAFAVRAGRTPLDGYLRAQAATGDRAWAEVVSAPVGRSPLASLLARLEPDFASCGGGSELGFAFDRAYYLPDDLLLKEDRMTMACSVEGRVPYLDEDLAAYARRLPLADKIRGAEGKSILRRIARRHLPPDIVDRPKHGFSVPVTEWLRGPLRPLLVDALGKGDAAGALAPRVLARWIGEHLDGRRDRGAALWALLSYEMWSRSPSGPGGRVRGPA